MKYKYYHLSETQRFKYPEKYIYIRTSTKRDKIDNSLPYRISNEEAILVKEDDHNIFMKGVDEYIKLLRRDRNLKLLYL